jgi:hypothetical protein
MGDSVSPTEHHTREKESAPQQNNWFVRVNRVSSESVRDVAEGLQSIESPVVRCHEDENTKLPRQSTTLKYIVRTDDHRRPHFPTFS